MNIPRFPKICVDCGKNYLARVGTQKYCDDCRSIRNDIGRKTSKSTFKYKSKSCERCNTVYTPTSGGQKYCIKCRQEVKKERDNSYKEHEPQTKICNYCGEHYEVTGNNQKYCLKCSRYLESLEKYRKLAFDNLPPVCNRCGKNVTFKTSHVHHKDRNHDNCTVENLEILCVPCHRREHVIRDEKTGKIITNK
jgi:5-methylcytosine-specific restriction endonuclease McrA